MELLSKNLENTLSESKEIRQEAESLLKVSQKDENYHINLINLVEISENPVIKLASVITFKNLVKDTDMVWFILLDDTLSVFL